MKHEIKITLEWWKISAGTISPSQREMLFDEGKSHAIEMMQDGYTSGELHHETDEDEFRGHFSIDTETIE